MRPRRPKTLPSAAESANGISAGILIGVLIALWLFAPYRLAFLSQLRFAWSPDSLGWLRVLDSRKSERELPRLDATASRRPDDYLLQVGRTTVSAAFDNLASSERASPTPSNDRTMLRLASLPRIFPASPGAYAHFIRYMTASFVRVDSADPDYQLHPDHRHLTLWAIQNGEKLDPRNAYWPGMHLVLSLADGKTEDAIALLSQFYQNSYWESYVFEEALGQWRLYAETYGDQGAVQKIAPLSLIAFPHLQQLRAAAERLRAVADNEEKRGKPERAIEIRRGLIRLSKLLQAQSRWAYEALFGTEILRIAITDSTKEKSKLVARAFHPRLWEQLATNYLALLNRNGRGREIERLRREMNAASELRDRIDQARYDTSYPGIPPGIPLAALFNNWMADVGLLRQCLSLLLLTGIIWVADGVRKSLWPPHIYRTVAMIVFLFSFTISGLSLLIEVPEAGVALIFFWSAAALLLLCRIVTENGTELEAEGTIRSAALLRLLASAVIPFVVLAYETRPLMGARHPVALLLNGAMGVHPAPALGESLTLACLTAGIALGLVLGILVWSSRRRTTLRSLFRLFTSQLLLPLLASLSVIYLFHLSHTINLDRLASRAINEAAQDDLQWVLTHGGG